MLVSALTVLVVAFPAPLVAQDDGQLRFTGGHIISLEKDVLVVASAIGPVKLRVGTAVVFDEGRTRRTTQELSTLARATMPVSVWYRLEGAATAVEVHFDAPSSPSDWVSWPG